MFPPWIRDYVGLPFAEHGRGPAYDCWGLVKRVLSERYGIEMPDYGNMYTHTNDREGIPTTLRREAAAWDRVQDPREGDVILITIAGKPMHCGLVLTPGYMLHCRDNIGSCVERYDRPQWSSRIEGIYRHRGCN